jgi:hypothetical protein
MVTVARPRAAPVVSVTVPTSVAVVACAFARVLGATNTSPIITGATSPHAARDAARHTLPHTISFSRISVSASGKFCLRGPGCFQRISKIDQLSRNRNLRSPRCLCVK